MKRKATAILMNGIIRRTADFCAVSDDKSYYHRFTANKICKTILTLAVIHDTLYRKSHHFCRKVQNGEDLFPMKIFTAPQHTRFILPLTSPDKIHRYAAWAVFFFYGKRTLKIS